MITDEKRIELDIQLDRLNQEVTEVLAKRKAWMDAHMADYAKYPIGAVLRNGRTKERLGVVTEHYRYWADRDPRYDHQMAIEYEFNTHDNCFDNTSRHAGKLWIEEEPAT